MFVNIIACICQDTTLNLEHPKISGETTVQNAITEVAAMMGENVRLRRGYVLPASSNGFISTYLHTSPQPGKNSFHFLFFFLLLSALLLQLFCHSCIACETLGASVCIYMHEVVRMRSVSFCFTISCAEYQILWGI